MFLKSLSKWEKLGVFLTVILLFGAGFLMFTNPSITGFVPAEYALKNLEVVVLKNQTYTLCAQDNRVMELTSVLISGKVIGDGEVKVFIESDTGEKRLVYSNSIKEKGLTSITGYAIQEEGELIDFDVDFLPEQEMDILPEFEKEAGNYQGELQAFADLLKSETQDNKKQMLVDFIQNSEEGIEFKSECIETCAIFNWNYEAYKFIFEVDSGTILMVDEIIYSIETGEDI